MNTYKIRGYDVVLYKSKYQFNKSLAVIANTTGDEPFACLTVCIDATPEKGCAYVDTNNCSWVEKFLVDNGIATPTSRMGESGFCVYPEYKFDLTKIN